MNLSTQNNTKYHDDSQSYMEIKSEILKTDDELKEKKSNVTQKVTMFKYNGRSEIPLCRELDVVQNEIEGLSKKLETIS